MIFDYETNQSDSFSDRKSLYKVKSIILNGLFYRYKYLKEKYILF